MHLKGLRLWLAGIGLMGAAAMLSAHDVSVGPLEWAQPDDAPDQKPVAKQPLRVDFPDELKKTADVGYAFLEWRRDEKGKLLSLDVRGTLPAYVRAVLDASNFQKFEPARRNGKPVEVAMRQTVIFNPSTAAADTADATPRLLEVVPAVAKTKSRQKLDRVDECPVVWCRLSIDAAGKVVAVKDAPAEYEKECEEAGRAWRFAPARQAGQAVATELKVPMLVIFRGENERYDEAPRLIKGVEPEYPRSQRNSRMRGYVTVEFIITREGNVEKPRVIKSLNPAFDEAALVAIRQFKFRPAQYKGRPVAVAMAQPFDFKIQGLQEGGDDGFEVEKRGRMEQMPPELRYDVAPKPLTSAQVVFPYALLRDDREGEATVALQLDVNGKVVATKILQASAPEFGQALQAAAELFTYEPAMRDGHPTATLISFRQKFDTDPKYQLVDNRDEQLLRVEKKHPEQIVSAKTLDAKLHPVSMPPPQFPPSVRDATQGEATVEFLIDTDGRVRLPRVVKATQEAFGYAAVQAVARWRFDPPKAGGKPAITRAKLPLSFNLADRPAPKLK